MFHSMKILISMFSNFLIVSFAYTERTKKRQLEQPGAKASIWPESAHVSYHWPQNSLALCLSTAWIPAFVPTYWKQNFILWALTALYSPMLRNCPPESIISSPQGALPSSTSTFFFSHFTLPSKLCNCYSGQKRSRKVEFFFHKTEVMWFPEAHHWEPSNPSTISRESANSVSVGCWMMRDKEGSSGSHNKICSENTENNMPLSQNSSKLIITVIRIKIS